MKDKDLIKLAKSVVDEFLGVLDVEADFTTEMSSYETEAGDEERFIDIKIQGEDLGVLIGYLGKNLRALQAIFSLILNRRLRGADDGDEFVRVVLDVSGYREKRVETLEQMARRIREEVLSSSEPVDLPTMSSFERRVIHLALKEYDDVTTESFGEGATRHVRVIPIGVDKKEVKVEPQAEKEEVPEEEEIEEGNRADDDGDDDSGEEDFELKIHDGEKDEE